MLRYLVLLSILSFQSVVAQQQQQEIDFECGGTNVIETHIKANETITIGKVPAGLHRLGIFLWSDVDMDIQLLSTNNDNEPVIHWLNGIVYHGEVKQSVYNNDTFEYSGYNGDGHSSGNEYILFDGITTNEYEFQIYATTAGSIVARYGWIPLESCNIIEQKYSRRLPVLNKQTLHDQIDEHTKISYTAAWTALQVTDQNPNDSKQIIGIYTRKGIDKTWRDGSSTCGGNREDCWNREHVWAQSRGDFDTVNGAGTDLHALRSEDRSVNTQRSNKSFFPGGSVVPDCSICLQTSTYFEPPNVAKGAVARMLFYMAVRYNGDADSNGITLNMLNGDPAPLVGTTTGQIGDLETLKAWNNQYPPSVEEIYRNNAIEAYFQGNRNPFIDNPYFANILF